LTLRTVTIATVVTLAVAGAGVLGLTRWPLPQEGTARERLTALADAADVAVESAGAPRLQVLPRPTVTFGDVQLRRRDGTATASIERVRLLLEPLALLQGEWRVSHVQLGTPQLRLAAGGSVPAISRGLLTWLQENRAAGLPARLDVEEGSLRLEGEAAPLQALSLSLRHGAAEGSLSLVGNALWKRESISLTASVAAPGDSPPRLSLDADSRLLRLALAGTMADGGESFAGTVDLRSPEGMKAARWLGHAGLDAAPALAGARLSGKVQAGAGQIDWSQVRIEFDSNRLDGVARYAAVAGGTHRLSATLDAGDLDITPHATLLLPWRDGGGAWSDSRFQLPFGDLPEMDLRLSVGTLTLAGHALRRAGITVTARGGRAELAVGDARYHDGAARGRLVLQHAPAAGLDMRLQASLDEADAEGLSKALLGQRALSGTAALTLQLEGRGGSVAELMHQLDGRGTLLVREGELLGVDLERWLRRIERQQGPVQAPPGASGRTAFTELGGQFSVRRGVAELVDASMVGRNLRVPLGGRADIADRALDMTARPQRPADAPGPTVQVPLRITGPWDRLMVAPAAATGLPPL
jgi:AsmA protein